MEIIETFSKLFDGLTVGLEKNIDINYSVNHIPPECSIGVFLSKIPNYKQHLTKKLHKSYKQKRKSLKKMQIPESKSPEFDILMKKLLRLSEVYLAFFARFQRNYIRSAIEKSRKWLYKAIASLAKDNILCRLNMSSSSVNYRKKLQEFAEDYAWKRFYHYLEGISSGYAKVTERKLGRDIKERIDQYVKHSAKISKHVCIENLYFSEASSDKKLKKTCSNYCNPHTGRDINGIPGLFSDFLTLQETSATIVQGSRRYNKSVPISRTSTF